VSPDDFVLADPDAPDAVPDAASDPASPDRSDRSSPDR
jgi:hypothetical protein